MFLSAVLVALKDVFGVVATDVAGVFPGVKTVLLKLAAQFGFWAIVAAVVFAKPLGLAAIWVVPVVALLCCASSAAVAFLAWFESK